MLTRYWSKGQTGLSAPRRRARRSEEGSQAPSVGWRGVSDGASGWGNLYLKLLPHYGPGWPWDTFLGEGPAPAPPGPCPSSALSESSGTGAPPGRLTSRFPDLALIPLPSPPLAGQAAAPLPRAAPRPGTAPRAPEVPDWGSSRWLGRSAQALEPRAGCSPPGRRGRTGTPCARTTSAPRQGLGQRLAGILAKHGDFEVCVV